MARFTLFTAFFTAGRVALFFVRTAMRDKAMPASIPPNAVATLAHLGVKSAHRPHAAAVRELACAALSMLRSATAHTPSLHRVLLVGALGDDRVLNSTTPTGAAESL